MCVLFFYGIDFCVLVVLLLCLVYQSWVFFYEELFFNNFLLSYGLGICFFNFIFIFSCYLDYLLLLQWLFGIVYLCCLVFLFMECVEWCCCGYVLLFYLQLYCDVLVDWDCYVCEFMCYILVDFYGKCLQNWELFIVWLQDIVMVIIEDLEFLVFLFCYKFYLVLENVICNDYMIEKLWCFMYLGVVFVYCGFFFVRDWMLNNYFVILIDDFEFFQKLVEFIDFLDKNDEEYMKYLVYK